MSCDRDNQFEEEEEEEEGETANADCVKDWRDNRPHYVNMPKIGKRTVHKET